jgi:hypothetical protein
MHMAKLRLALAGGAALALTVAGVSAAGTADGQGAQKSGLSPTAGSSSSQCNAGSGANTNGFAILNAPGKVGSVTKVNGEVSLKRGPANTTFIVNLAQGGNCVAQGMFVTNGQGNGNFHINQSGTLGGPYYVVLQDSMMNEVYASQAVALK